MKINKWGLICVVGLLMLATACSKKQAVESRAEVVPPVEDSIEAFGIVKAEKIKNISLDVPADIEQIHVVEGQKVSLGETLITLDLSKFEQDIQDKESEKTISELELQKLQNGTDTTENNLSTDQKEANRIKNELETKKAALANNTDPDIKKLFNELSLAETTYKDAQIDFEKQKVLYGQGAISKADFEDAQRELENKKNDVVSTKLSIDTLKSTKQKEINELQKSLDKTNTNIRNAKIELGVTTGQESSSVQIQKEKIASLENNINQLIKKTNQSFIKDNKIVSDINNGVVYDIGYVEGDTIEQGKKIFSIMDLDSIIVEANVSEEFIKDIKIGAEVTILPVADSSKEYKGKVSKIANMAIKQNGETVVPIQVSIKDSDEFLYPNFNVDVKILK